MFLPLAATIFVAATAAADPVSCTYDHAAPVIENGREQYVFLGPCGFYEVGYHLEGNTLHLPRGGTHALLDVSEAEAQDILREAYGLVDTGGETLIRTKDVVKAGDRGSD